ncbi:MAG: molybdate ABC transporter substrate-binding protein [Bacteroidota bacterium]
MKKNVLIRLFVIIIISGCSSEYEKEKSLLVYSGAGMKDPMNEIAVEFEKEFAIEVNYVYGGSGVIFAKIEMQKTGDVFMPGSGFFMNTAKEKGYIDSSKSVVLHIPVIIVAKGNPKKINSIKDLSKENIRISLAKEDACAICNLAPKIFKKAGIYEYIKKNAVTTSRTNVNELALDVVLNEADAAIVWRSSAKNYIKQNKADIIEINKKVNIIKIIPIAVLNFSKNKEDAEKFKEFVISKKDVWKKYGYADLEEKDITL